MKKAQSQLAFVFVLVFAVIVLLWGLGIFDNLGKSTNKAEISNFVTSLERAAKKQAIKFESVAELSLALPQNIETICLLDRNKEFNELANVELSSKINNFPEHNLILTPFQDFNSFDVDLITVEESPLCVENKEGRILLRLTGKGNKTLIETAETGSDCTTVLFNGEQEDKIDIVFLADGYENEEDFSSDVNDYINVVFKNAEPFDSNFRKFNFYRTNELNLGCEIKSYVSCNALAVKQSASNCPNDYIFVLSNRNKFKDLVNPVRSSAVSNFAAINTEDHRLVLLHEFGHVFGGLADEYVDDSYYRNFDVNRFPNCDFSECVLWEDVTNGCFSGCSVNQFFRASETSLMRDYFKSEGFGVLNENILEEKLDKYD